MENDAKATLAQVEQKARAAADEVARTTATAARALFTALVVGLLAALVGLTHNFYGRRSADNGRNVPRFTCFRTSKPLDSSAPVAWARYKSVFHAPN
jgi:hypothetical protein